MEDERCAPERGRGAVAADYYLESKPLRMVTSTAATGDEAASAPEKFCGTSSNRPRVPSRSKTCSVVLEDRPLRYGHLPVVPLRLRIGY
jgi:hypothetical protein